MFNQVTLAGHLGRDPDLRITQSGDKVVSLSLATTERWKDRSGSSKEATQWHSVIVWGPLAEVANTYLSKGSKLMVQGMLKHRKWQAQDGSDRWSAEVVLSGPHATLRLLDSKPDGNGKGGDTVQSADFNDDIPF